MKASELENALNEKKTPSKKKVLLVDTFGNITSSILIGMPLDYWTGLRGLGIIGSRASSTPLNFFPGCFYGGWREKCFNWTNTKPEHNIIRKTLVDLAAFNSFQAPVYGIAVAIGSWLEEGYVNMDKVKDGMENLVFMSPIIGPLTGFYMDGFRRLFGIKSASKGAYKENE
jgi:hypothetical protein